MADAKITQLPAGSAMQAADLLPAVQDVPGTPVTNKVTMTQVAAAIQIILGIGNVPEVPVDYKDSVLVATTANIALTGEQTLDGVLTSASRVLVWKQTNAAQNGLYVSAAGAWSRSTDADTSAEVTPGMLVGVESGTLYANLIFNLITTGTITLGTTNLTFAPFNLPTVLFPGTTISGTSQTGVLLHSGRRLNFTNAAAKTYTVPPQTGGGGVAFAVNTEIDLFNAGAGVLTVAAGAGVTVNSSDSQLTIAQYRWAKLKKRANPNTWDLVALVPAAAAGTRTVAVFTPMTACPPATDFALADTRNSFPTRVFVETGDRGLFWVGVVPEGMTFPSGMTANIKWTAGTAVVGDAVLEMSLMRMTTDIDIDSYDTVATVAQTCSATNGVAVTSSITNTAIDSIVAGDLFAIKIRRLPGNASDTMAGSLELLSVELRAA